MIQKVAKIKDIKDHNSINEDLRFWLKKSPEERISTIEYLRRQYHGSAARLQRVARVVQLSQN